MKDKLTLWIVGLALDKNKQAIVTSVSVLIGALCAYLSTNLPEWARPYATPEIVGLLVVAAINFAINFLASGPLKAHGAKLQAILNDTAKSVGLDAPPLLTDG